MTENEEQAVKWMKSVRGDAVVTLDYIAKNEPNVSPMLYAGRKEKAGAIIKGFEELERYRAIGTVEECREARERQRGKKPNITIGKTEEDKLACCPICEGNLDWTYNGFWRKGNPKYCSNCGQAIDWSDTPLPTK